MLSLSRRNQQACFFFPCNNTNQRQQRQRQRQQQQQQQQQQKHRSAIYFLDAFVLVHYNINYDPKRTSHMPHPIFFARNTSGGLSLQNRGLLTTTLMIANFYHNRHDAAIDALVFLESNSKEPPENKLLSQFWRSRYREFLLPPRQSVVWHPISQALCFVHFNFSAWHSCGRASVELGGASFNNV